MTVDIAELKALAQAAEPGPWWISGEPENDLMGINADGHSELAQVIWKMDGQNASPMCQANARFIAAANPAAVLEILENLGSLAACGFALTDALLSTLLMVRGLTMDESVPAAARTALQMRAALLADVLDKSGVTA